jgi:hypothetical protein
LSAIGRIQALAGLCKNNRVRRRAEQVGRLWLGPQCGDDAFGLRIDDAQVIATGVGAHDVTLVGRDREAAGMHAREDFFRSLAAIDVDNAHGAFAGDVPNRVDANDGAATGRAGQVAVSWPAAAPVAHVRLLVHQHDVVGGDADVERSQCLAGGRIDFKQSVR